MKTIFSKKKTRACLFLVPAFFVTGFAFQNCAPNSLEAQSNSDTRPSTKNPNGNLLGMTPQPLHGSVASPSTTNPNSNGEVVLPSGGSEGFGFSADDINTLSQSNLTNTGSGILCKLYARKEVAPNETISLQLVAYNWSGQFPSVRQVTDNEALYYNMYNPMFDISGEARLRGTNPDGQSISEVATKWFLLRGGYVSVYKSDIPAGNYTRYVEIKDANGGVVCRTNTVHIKLLAANEMKSPIASDSCQTKDVITVPYYTEWPKERTLCPGVRILSFKDTGEFTSVGAQAIYDFMDQDISQLGALGQGILTAKRLSDGVLTMKYCKSGRALVSGVKLYTNSGMPNDGDSYFDSRFNRNVSVKAYSSNVECID